MKRSEARLEDTWALEDLYETEEAMRKDRALLEEEITAFDGYRGRLLEGSAVLYEMLNVYSRMSRRFEKVYVYANQKLHQDMGDGSSQKAAGEVQNLMNRLNAACAYMVPEILQIPKEKLEMFFGEEKGLEKYRHFLEEILRQKEHTLSGEKEELLARVGELGGAPSNIFAMFNNADVTFAPIFNEHEEEVSMTQGSYIRYMESKSRRVRKEAFTSLYEGYSKFKNTLAATYEANVKQAAFFAGERNYASSLEAALDDSEIPTAVYDNLIQTVHGHLDLMHRYMQIRKERLGLEELHMYDIYVPMVEDVDMKISYPQAKEIVKKGLRPLGEEYLTVLQEGFDNRWIDVYENEGKRTGAYSWGAYGTHPYVLLNHQENLNSVFTLAHEMGHALHSYYSDKNLDYIYAGYKIFVAEVASTCNEALLIHDLMERAADEKEKAYLINYFLEQFRTTLYRQTMFAEFERRTHQMVEKREPLTADVLCDLYYELNREYFGPEVVLDDEIRYEWSRIPHFYTPFYVYQYATGFSAAIAISSKILKGEPGIVEKYKKFLSGGCSMDPISLLKLCDVDMTRPEPIEEALKVFEEYLNQLEK